MKKAKNDFTLSDMLPGIKAALGVLNLALPEAVRLDRVWRTQRDTNTEDRQLHEQRQARFSRSLAASLGFSMRTDLTAVDLREAVVLLNNIAILIQTWSE